MVYRALLRYFISFYYNDVFDLENEVRVKFT